MKDLFTKIFSKIKKSNKNKVDLTDMPGKHDIYVNPKASKYISSLNLTYFKMSINGFNESITGYIEIYLAAYNENDKYLIYKAQDDVLKFKELGYMVWVKSYDKLYDSYIDFKAAVNQDFMQDFALLVKQSDIVDLNGTNNHIRGIPEDIDNFSLVAKYKSDERIDVSINSYIPNKAIKLFKLLKPLLIKKMMETKANYSALINFDREIVKPKELIKEISLEQTHNTKLNTFSFKLEIKENIPYLTANFTDFDGSYNLTEIKITKADLNNILNGFLSNRYIFVPEDFSKEDNISLLENSTYNYYIIFNGIDEKYKPYYGIYDEKSQDMFFVFKDVAKNYTN